MVRHKFQVGSKKLVLNERHTYQNLTYYELFNYKVGRVGFNYMYTMYMHVHMHMTG